MKKMVLCLLATVFALVLHAQETHKGLDYAWFDLNGSWKFNKGDNAKWAKPGFNDKDWADMIVPAWDGGFTGFAWYRKTLLLQTKNKEALALTLGQVDDNCEVYFNGQLVKLYDNPRPGNDITDTSVYSQWKKYRVYYIPKKLVEPGKANTIAVKVWNTDAEGGIRYGNVQLTSTVFYNHLPIQMAGDWIKADGSNENLVGFYDNVVVYKNRVWKYSEITNSDGLYEMYLLDRGFGHLFIKQVADNNGTINLAIGPDADHLELCKRTETYNNNAGEKDQTYLRLKPVAGNAIYKGFIKNYSLQMGRDALIDLQGKNNGFSEKRVSLDQYGAFSIELPLTEPTIVIMRAPGVSYGNRAYLEPGKTTFQVIDLAEYKIYVTEEFYTRDHLTVFQGDLAMENKLLMYTDWLAGLQTPMADTWSRFMAMANQYETSGNANDVQMNSIAAFVADNYQKYNDTAALKKAKLWSARTLRTNPDNHLFYSTLNTVLQNLGEHLNGLQYLAKALDLADKDKDQQSVEDYKKKIKQYVGEMLK